MGKKWLVLLLLAGPAASAASFDCSKAKIPREKAICASPELSAADERMAVAYRTVLNSATPEMIGEIRADQRSWLRKLATNCTAEETGLATASSECLLLEYDSRIKALQHMVLHQGGVTFVWRSISITAPSESAANAPGAGIGNDNSYPGYLNASWPQANSSAQEWKVWNAAIEAATHDLAGQQGGGGEIGENGKLKWSADPEMDIEVTASIGLVGDRLVTASIDDSWYGHGAAHPNLDSIQFNWQLKDRRELRPGDLFQANSDWRAHLYQRCMKSLVAQFGDKYPQDQWAPGYLDKTLHGIVENPRIWSLNPDDLTISFQIGSVSCRICVADPVRFPWAELKPLLNPKFAIPRELPAGSGSSQ